MWNYTQHLLRLVLGLWLAAPISGFSQNIPVLPETDIAPSWKAMTFGQIRPMSWLKDRMQDDIHGMTSRLDSITSEIHAAVFYFGDGQLSRAIDTLELDQVEASLLWWNSLIEHAILTQNQQLLPIAKSYIDQQISHQAEDGYWGIFTSDRRYQPQDLNTACNTTALLLNGLLKWAIYAHDKELLERIEHAVQNAYAHLPDPTADADLQQAGILTSGMVLVDVLFDLYHWTGQTIHQDFINTLLHLATNQPRSSITGISTLEAPVHAPDPAYYAALRQLAAGWMLSADPDSRQAMEFGLEQISSRLLPSGAIENPDPTDKGQNYHFEDVLELMKSYVFLLKITGDPQYAEAVERLYLNALPGMFTSNRMGLVSPQKEDHTIRLDQRQPDPIVHPPGLSDEARVGHIHPTYIQALWFKDGQGFVNSCFAPCELNTRWGSRHVRIQEIMDYPGDYRVRINVQTDSACTFMIKIRKPKWARAITINQPYNLSGDFIHIEKEWSGFEEISIVFAPGVSNFRTATGRRWYTFGPLVLAYNLDSHQEQSSETASESGIPIHYTVRSTEKPKRAHGADAGDLRFSLLAKRSDHSVEETIQLIPFGQTTYRQSTFPEYQP